MRITIACAVLAGSLLAAPAAGQGLARRITAADDGEVRMSFASRPDVCGDGVHTIRQGRRNRVTTDNDDSVEWDGNCNCEEGPVRVAFTVRSHRVVKVRTWVGGRWRVDGRTHTDLGSVAVRDAAPALLAIAGDPGNSGGEHAIFPATLADSVTVWPDLLRLARDTRAPHDTRRQAVFWVSQAAGDSATAGLAQLAENESEESDIRKQAVFALSQRPSEEGVPALIRLAKSNRDPEVRRTAIFWLGQSEDPRALALFEELLVRR